MKQFRCYLFLFVFLFFSLPLVAQFDSKKYNKESFLVGTLNEYFGYQRSFTGGDYYQRVDLMNRSSLQYALFIESLFKADNPDIKLVDNGAPMGLIIYSSGLSQKIDEYYNYTFSRNIKYDYLNHDVYIGTVKGEVFETEKQKLSFLLGAYLFYHANKGVTESVIQVFKRENLLKEDRDYRNVYMMNVPNGGAKALLVAQLLKDMDCEEVEYIYRDTTIPRGHAVIFKPSKKVKRMIDEAERLETYIKTLRTYDVKFASDGTKLTNAD